MAAGAASVTLFSESAASVVYNVFSSNVDAVFNGDQIIIGLDMGGGTTDISVVEKKDLVFTEVATFGSANDGGETIDCLLTDTRKNILMTVVVVVVPFRHQYKINIADKRNSSAYIEVRNTVQEVKHMLSEQESVELVVEPMELKSEDGSSIQSERYSIVVTRKHLEDVIVGSGIKKRFEDSVWIIFDE